MKCMVCEDINVNAGINGIIWSKLSTARGPVVCHECAKEIKWLNLTPGDRIPTETVADIRMMNDYHREKV